MKALIPSHKEKKRYLLVKGENLKKNKKKGVSIMIGYVLLITFAVVISVFVYQWLKTYVPKEGIECPDGVSMYISDATLDTTTKELSLTFVNNGRFSVGGVFIYYSEDSSQKIATKDLSKNVIFGGVYLNPGVRFTQGVSDNPVEPSDEKIIKFDVNGIDSIYEIETTPIRWQENKNKKEVASCTDAKTKKRLDLTI